MRFVDADALIQSADDYIKANPNVSGIFEVAKYLINQAQTVEVNCESCHFKEFTENVSAKLVEVMLENDITDFDELAKRVRGDKT